jgi:hypothetical protein
MPGAIAPGSELTLRTEFLSLSDGLTGDTGFSSRRDVLRARALQDLLRFRYLVRVLRVHRNEHIASLYTALIALCLEFRNTQADESAGDSSDRSADGCTAQGGDYWSCSDERADTWYREGSYAHQPAQRATKDAAGGNSSDRALRCLRIFSWANPFVDALSGKRTEMSPKEAKRAILSMILKAG